MALTEVAGGVMTAALPAEVPATLVLTGAGDATVSVNGYVTASRGDTRVLATPALAADCWFAFISLFAEVRHRHFRE